MMRGMRTVASSTCFLQGRYSTLSAVTAKRRSRAKDARPALPTAGSPTDDGVASTPANLARFPLYLEYLREVRRKEAAVREAKLHELQAQHLKDVEAVLDDPKMPPSRRRILEERRAKLLRPRRVQPNYDGLPETLEDVKPGSWALFMSMQV